MSKKNKIIAIITIFLITGGLLFGFLKKTKENKNIQKESAKRIDKSKIVSEKKEVQEKESNKKEENRNYKICIDPGHQEKGNFQKEELAPGSKIMKYKVAGGATGGTTKKPEYKLTLEIGLKLRDVLKSNGYDVFMVREKNDVNISNKERALMTNKAGCSVYLRLHADDSDGKSTSGVSVLTSSAKNPYTKSVQKSSEEFSKAILEEYVKATGFKNNGISYRDDLTGTNWSTVTNTLLEMGFLSNPDEDVKMSDPKFQDKMVVGIVNGIEKYLKLKKY